MKTSHHVFLLLCILLLTSCAKTQPQVEACLPEHIYGFWAGLWHGIIAPFSFIGSLIWDDLAVWAVNNNGNWYTFGFLLGIGAFSGGASKASS
jgi:hypothetical protein